MGAAKPAKVKKPAKKAEHPPSAVMVVAAVKALKDKKGSSLAAIKKYIAANYKVDVVKVSPFIRKAIKKLVADKKLIQVKASFKAAKEEKPKKAKKPKAKKPKAKKPKKTAAKKTPKRRQQRKPPPKRLRPPRRPRPPKNPQLRSPQPKRAQRRQQRKPHPKRSRC